MILRILSAVAALVLVGCGRPDGETGSLTRYVNPYIGTGDHGHVFLGANVPHGLVQVGPTQPTQEWDWCSGYHYSDSLIVGFGHHHLSGTGIGDLGDISLMPVAGDVTLPSTDRAYMESSLVSRFSHERERVRPGYYSVHLERDGVDVELTATSRVGLHRHTFPAAGQSSVVIDLIRGINWDKMTDAFLRQESDTQVSGYRMSSGWAADQRVYFWAEFSKPMRSFAIEGFPTDARSPEGYAIGTPYAFGQAVFDMDAGGEVLVKVGISAVSVENAKENMEAELPGWDFEATAAAADELWNEELARIDFETANGHDKTIFYTAMYHYAMAPIDFQDVNGDYRGADGYTHRDTTFTNYSIFSLWDTYRATHPLMTIIDTERCADVEDTFMNIFRQQGKLPVWHLVGNETDCMVGNPGVIVLADMVLKGLARGDGEQMLEAMKTSAMLDERSLEWLKKYGYIPYDVPRSYESVGKTMEYAIADHAIADVAASLGKTADESYFRERSKAYRYFFDPATEFMRGRSVEGSFIEPLQPTWTALQGMSVYTEGNAWQYTFLVPHDVYGLIGLFPDEAAFTAKLDSLFVAEGDAGPYAAPDVTGLIGQYAHGNEPSHHITYLYPYVGQQWKTAEKVRHIMTTLYSDQPAGLCGNEDVGQMSSWYILSAMGLYQVDPAGGDYVFGSPIMDKATIKLPEGKTFEITARGNSPENIYIQSVRLDGEQYTWTYISYADIMKGGKLEFTMGSEPSQFGTAKEDRPR